MKRYSTLFSLLCFTLYTFNTTATSPQDKTEKLAPPVNPQPTTDQKSQTNGKTDPLVVVLMVKDEESVMVRTLEPFVKAGVQSYVILDTGSTDRTKEVTAEYFKANGIKHGHIFEPRYKDEFMYEGDFHFSFGRNRALELAEETFPDKPFLIMVDAEWYIQNVPALIDFCKEYGQFQKGDPRYSHSYLVHVNAIGAGWDYRSARLMRPCEKLRYVNQIHEIVPQGAWLEVPRSIHFIQNPERFGNEKSVKRWTRDLRILLRSYHRNPNARDIFYLARTYHCLGELENAYRIYRERSMMVNTWHPEEDWMAKYYQAQLTEQMAKSNPAYTWTEAQRLYLEAYTMRPKRAEPLIHLAKHYNEEGNNALAYLYARRSVEIPFPHDEWLWVERELYEFTRYDILSKCAWYEKEFKVGEEATIKAIESRPNTLYLYKNLSFYWDNPTP